MMLQHFGLKHSPLGKGNVELWDGHRSSGPLGWLAEWRRGTHFAMRGQGMQNLAATDGQRREVRLQDL